MNNYTQTFAPVTQWAKDTLTRANRAFAKAPNATNWAVTTRAMLVHQQLEFAVRSASVDRDKLSFDLDNNPIGAWPDVICRATLGLTCTHALKQSATL